MASLKEIIDAKKKLLEQQQINRMVASNPETYDGVYGPEDLPVQIKEAPPVKKTLSQIIAERLGKTQPEANTTTSTIPSSSTIQEAPLIPSFSKLKLDIPLPTVEEKKEEIIVAPVQDKEKKHESFALDITLNQDQLLATELAFAGKSFCLIGAAGTGKTTTQREIAKSLLKQNKLGTHTFRVQGTGERWAGPSIAFVAFTRIASGNLKRAIHKDPELSEVFLHNITTIHNLLEYEPVYYYDEEKEKETMRFIPRRNAANPLEITHLVIEEGSMVGISDLWPKLYDALPDGVQIIILGDINQLPPVFGSSVLNYALIQLPVIELKKVYRQKEGSSILDNAHKILRGDFPLIEDKSFRIIRGGDTQYGQFKMAQMLGTVFPRYHAEGYYDPSQDIILSPFNVQDLGTENMNKWIAQFLGTARNATVYEIKAGMTKHYLAVGDKVMYNKQVGEIVSISGNSDYMGPATLAPSNLLSRFGFYNDGKEDDLFEDDSAPDYSNIDIDKYLEGDIKDDAVRSASHHVQLLMETGETIDLNTVGDFGSSVFSLGYCLTVHKAQGCEWRKVFIILHKDHSVMAFRELLYTAVTRSREECIIIAKDFMIQKAIKNPRIKGNSLSEKIEYFNSGAVDISSVRIVK